MHRLGLIKSALAVAVLAVGSAAQAATYSLDFQSVTFNIEDVDSDTFTLSILNADNASGDWTGVNYLRAFALKDIGSFSSATATGTGGAWNFSSNELNADGCAGGSSGGICFSGLAAVAPSMSWTIDVVGGTLAFAEAGPHLKVNFDVDTTGKKTGSNLSQSVGEVPLPGTLGLLGLGLAALGVVRRKTQ